MVGDNDVSTRRQFLRSSTGLAAAGLLAGCTGSPTGSNDSGSSESSYAVSIEPVGAVEFDSVPEQWVTSNGSWADMGIALGLEPPEAVTLTDRYHTHYYDGIDGVSVDTSDMVSLYQDGVNVERFYNLDADIHIIDPNFLKNRAKSVSGEDIEAIEDRAGPFFGNCSYAQHYPWHDDYRYYSLMECFEKLAKVFQREERYEAFEGVHEEFQSNLAPVVPGGSERPSAAVAWGVGKEPTKFYPYVIGGGTGFKHLRDLKVRDAFAASGVKDFHGTRAAIDVETLLDVDPEVLLLRGYENLSESTFQNKVVASLENNETASRITAVEEGSVYRAGGLYQGPIMNLVLTERLAGDLYGSDSELFDRERVADIVAGAV